MPIYAATTVDDTTKIFCDEFLPGCDHAGVEKNWKGADNGIVKKYIPSWTNWILKLLAGGAVLMIVVGGVMITMAGSDDDLKGRGQKTFIYALVGLAVAIFAYFIVTIVDYLAYPGTGT